ncbi:MAG: hypothetical protein KDK24_19555 [Pseudooceanicola sp.]|nr:hypothetical protein [Pseudooceanicola sp.]
MTSLAFHHSPHGAGDFLGLRRSRAGGLELVYDDGAQRRLVWRVTTPVTEQPLSEAMQLALSANRVLPALYSELKKRAIQIEALDRAV